MALNPIQKFLLWMANYKPGRDKVYPLEEELIEKDKQINVLVKKIQSVQAQLSHIKAKEREERERGQDVDEQREAASYLNEQQENINTEMIKGAFSLNKLFCDIYGVAWKRKGEFSARSRFGKTLEISDKNDENAWKFGEILVSKEGFFIITDSDNVPRAISPNINHLIYHPESMENQIKRGRILLAVDKEGRFIPDLDTVRIEHPVWNREKNIYEASTILKQQARELIKERDEMIKEKDEKLEHMEMVVAKLKSEMNDTKRANFLNESKKNIMQTELSKAMNSVIESDKIIGNLHREVSNSSELNVIYEKKIEKQNKIIAELLERFERVGAKTQFDDALEYIKEEMEFARTQFMPFISGRSAQPSISEPKPSYPGPKMQGGG